MRKKFIEMMLKDCNFAHRIEIDNTKALERIFCDELYLIDALDRFSIVAGRAGNVGDRERIERFGDIFGEEACAYLKEYLREYNKKPVLMKVRGGYALVHASIFPSTQMLLVNFIREGRKTDFLNTAVLSVLSEDISLFDIPHSRKSNKLGKETAAELARVVNDVNDLFRYFENRSYFSFTVSDDKLRTAIEAASSLVGCEVGLSVSGEVVCDSGFDKYSFGAYLLSMLLLCRRLGKTRKADIFVSYCKEGAAFEISFDTFEDISELDSKELSVMDALAQRNHMIFEYLSGGGVFRVRFCPVRKDWSVIGVKSDPEFVWDN